MSPAHGQLMQENRAFLRGVAQKPQDSACGCCAIAAAGPKRYKFHRTFVV
jgi:hypothetical protein